MADLKINISFDARMEAYTGYVPDGWIEKPPFSAVRRGCVLDRQLFYLGLAWRTAGYVASVPSTMPKLVQSATLAYATVRSPDASIVAFGEQVLKKVSWRVPELVENSALRAKLMEAIVGEATGFRETAESAEPEMPLEPMWQEFMAKDSFGMTAWASQRIPYLAFYNAYEAFLVDCMKCVLGVTSLRATDKAFMKGLREDLGTDVSGPCWGHQGVAIGREVRHSLTHGGGKPTSTLQGMKHDIQLVDGVLQIWPNKEVCDGHRQASPRVVWVPFG